MQCYLSGHSDGSLDSVDPSTEASSASAETGTGTLSVGRAQDREETSTREEKCSFESGESGDQGAELQENKTNDWKTISEIIYHGKLSGVLSDKEKIYLNQIIFTKISNTPSDT